MTERQDSGQSSERRWTGACGDASIQTRMEDGRRICIRTVTPADEARLREGIARMSPRSRYLRFFSGATTPPDWVIDRLLDADGTLHLAWGAIDLTDAREPAVAVVHAMRPDAGERVMEFSVGVLDEYHGRGLGRLLTATLLLDARDEAVDAFSAHVLAENEAARGFIRKLGAERVGQRGPEAEYRLEVAPALAKLRGETDPPGLADVFAYFDGLESEASRP
ncbi:GNAT family N-acetyltransferase [Qipengyuania sp. XHP0207]|uniref:GNAT family N-acetyltransferase n=1 Tax=Qipengyuania sp. XHP0207 TaxID=3038078 RepID=UPI00241F3411|nr:GNAT family N-acetyltransferase [Qipengyuania sp. XHP0207]MDG5747163.1 GNAT family N-acetyltransferase [Qipengyuania sp. XHP0207]